MILASLVTQIVLVVSSGSDVTTGEEVETIGLATRLVRLFSYFTIQSNLLVLAAALTLAANPYRDGPIWRVLRPDSLLGIVITGVVFATVLAGDAEHTGAAVWTNAGFHYFAPWSALLGWLLFGPRPRITWPVIGWTFVWPVLWIGYTLVHGAVTDWYPYPFLDVVDLGYPVALRNTAAVLVAAIVLAVAFKLLDRLPPRPDG